MDAYIYAADIYCADCGRDIRRRLRKAGQAPEHPNEEHTYDSDEYPKGPFDEGGGESDTPQHCGSGKDCLDPLIIDGEKYGCFLENPLTRDGVKYVLEQAKDNPDGPVTQFWLDHYRADGYDELRQRDGEDDDE